MHEVRYLNYVTMHKYITTTDFSKDQRGADRRALGGVANPGTIAKRVAK